jgi:O-antigen/teichoic acid export membrane protein
MLTGAASSALCPWIMRKLNAKETDTVSAISLDCSILLAASIVAVVTVAPEAMSILAPKSYSDATVAVLPIALSALPTFIYSLGCTVLIHRGFGARVSACALISSLCAVVLGFIFIPKFSYFGAGLAHLLAQTAAAVTVLIIMLGSGEKLFSATKICVIFVVTTSFAILARASVGQVALRILILMSSVSLIVLKLFRMRSLISEK